MRPTATFQQKSILIHVQSETLPTIPVTDELSLQGVRYAGTKRDCWFLRHSSGAYAGSFNVGFDTAEDLQPGQKPIPWISFSRLHDEYRGKGLGRLVMKKLVKHYGTLRSDLAGMTSDEAEKAWQAIGAKRLTPSRKRLHLDRSDYVLGKHQVKDSRARGIIKAVLEALASRGDDMLGLALIHYSDRSGFRTYYGDLYEIPRQLAQQMFDDYFGMGFLNVMDCSDLGALTDVYREKSEEIEELAPKLAQAGRLVTNRGHLQLRQNGTHFLVDADDNLWIGIYV